MTSGNEKVLVMRIENNKTLSVLKPLKNEITPNAHEVALLVTHTSDGVLKDHVPRYSKSLLKMGVKVHLIVIVDDFNIWEENTDQSSYSAVTLRKNAGFDFAAWSDVIRSMDLSQVKTLFLLNDSIIGPTSDNDFSKLITRILHDNHEFIYATSSLEISHHAQSYFMAFKQNAIIGIYKFLMDVAIFENKSDVTLNYEIPLLTHLSSAGIRSLELFPFANNQRKNVSILLWDILVAKGFPFIKAEAIRRMSPQKLPEIIAKNPQLANASMKIINDYGTLEAPYDYRLKDKDGVYTFHKITEKSRIKYAVNKAFYYIILPFSRRLAQKKLHKAIKYNVLKDDRAEFWR